MRTRFLALLLIIGGSLMAGSLVARADTASNRGSASSWADKALLEPDNEEAQRRVRGAVFDGLRKRSSVFDPCASTFTLDDVLVDGGVLCTHGPDPSPIGIDVRASSRLATTEDLRSGRAVPCEGDGVSGSRVQAVYVVAADRPDRYDEVLPSIRHWAAEVDRSISDSAAAHGGVRHARWVTNSSCELEVLKVVVPAKGDDTFSATVASLKAEGHVRPDRKYLMWTDANVYCGIATVLLDDSPGATNRNNGSKAMFGRVDAGCWGLDTPVEAHELVHTLGAVQLSAPNSSGGGHCTDEHDLLCYSDAPGVQITVICGTEWKRLLDCNGDDYFAIDPPAGSYLARHWNTARSDFLTTQAQTAPTGYTPAPAPATTTTTTTSTTAPPPPSTSTTAPPPPSTSTTGVPPTTSSTSTTSTTTTVQPTPAPVRPTPTPTPAPATSDEVASFAGSMSSRNRSDVHTVKVDGTGAYRITLTPSARASKSKRWRMAVLDGRGRLVEVARSRSTITMDHDLRTGRHRVIVMGGAGDYTVTVEQR